MTYIHISQLESIFECENDLDLDLECKEELEKEPENSPASPVYKKGNIHFSYFYYYFLNQFLS